MLLYIPYIHCCCSTAIKLSNAHILTSSTWHLRFVCALDSFFSRFERQHIYTQLNTFVFIRWLIRMLHCALHSHFIRLLLYSNPLASMLLIFFYFLEEDSREAYSRPNKMTFWEKNWKRYATFNWPTVSWCIITMYRMQHDKTGCRQIVSFSCACCLARVH